MKFCDFLLFFVMVAYIVLCPYTKVEESFNLQATHDILFYGVKDISKYDHFEFPGVVPRTFTGPLVLSAMVYPFKNLLFILGNRVDPASINKVSGLIHTYIPKFPETINPEIFNNKFLLQYATRIALSILVVWSFAKLRDSVTKTWSKAAGNFMILLTLAQFHLPFWGSRTLPNTFALILVNLAYSFWILKTTRRPANREKRISERKRSKIVIIILVFTAIVFRSEVGLLALPIIFVELKNKKISIGRLIKTVILTSIVSLAFTVGIDSYFWKKLIWPEGVVFYFNTVMNGSMAYGVSPWYNYLIYHLPKLCGLAIPFALYSFIEKERIRRLLVPAIFYVGAFSILPHKEARFIFYIVPLINIAGAVGLSYIYDSRKFSIFKRLCYWLALLAIFANLVISGMMGYVSSFNYPGGYALKKVNQLDSPKSPIKIHIGVYSAQTGASRFGETNSQWIYDKTENMNDRRKYIQNGYKYVLTLNPSFHDSRKWEIISSAEALLGVTYEKDIKKYVQTLKTNINTKEKDLKKYLPFVVHVHRKVYIIRRKVTDKNDD